MKSEISSKDDSAEPCENCGHEEEYHTGKDNWVRKSTSCHLCKCKKFIPQPKEWENHKERILEPQNHSPKSLKSKDNEPVCSDSGSDDDCSYCNGKGCVRCSARKLKDDESLSDKRKCITKHDCGADYDGVGDCEMGYPEEDVKEFINRIADKCFVINGFSTEGKARIVVDIEDIKELAALTGANPYNPVFKPQNHSPKSLKSKDNEPDVNEASENSKSVPSGSDDDERNFDGGHL